MIGQNSRPSLEFYIETMQNILYNKIVTPSTKTQQRLSKIIESMSGVFAIPNRQIMLPTKPTKLIIPSKLVSLFQAERSPKRDHLQDFIISI